MSWLGELLVDTANEFSNIMLDFVFGIVLEVFGTTNTVLNYREVNEILAISNLIASSFLVFVVMKQILCVYILEIDGDSEQSPLILIEKACIALALIQMQSYLLNFLLEMANRIGEEAGNSLRFQYESAEELFSIATTMMGHPFLLCFVIILYLIGFCFFIWKGMKRTIELVFMKILFPIFACDICTVSMERFNSFIMSYAVTIFGYVIQFIAFRFSILLLYSNEAIMLFMSVCCLFFAGSAPKWIDKYIYSSGIAKGAANGARGALYMLPQMMRMVR